ncbi:MAG: D-aminoacyl-tRNA deacylase [Chloroflexota bacterium]|nr:D-aminoacyl-tRNA deacylase [Chloroflexota bacterium]
MRALIQRVTSASVVVGGSEVGRIGPGLLVLLGVKTDDTEEDARYLVDKTLNLRIFSAEGEKFERSALDVGAELLVVSQFTLYASTRKGRRPDFTQAAPPEAAESLYRRAVELFAQSGLKVAEGRFREYMQVEIHNDGPVTLLLDSAERLTPRRQA